MQGKGIVHLHQFSHLVLLEADETLQVGSMLSRASHAMHHVALFLLSNKENVEHFNFALAAIVGCLVLPAPMKPNFDTLRFDELQNLHTVPHRLHQAGFDQFVQLGVGNFNVSGQIPTQVHHRNDAFVAFKLVPLVPLNRQLVLPRCQWTDIPCDIVAPSDGLHPMHTTSIHPHQVTRSLRKPIHRNIFRVQVL